MRGVGPLISLSGHAVVLFWGLVSFAPAPLESEIVDALPVEFVTLSEFTDLTKGVREAPEFIDSEEVVETPEVTTESISEAPGPADAPPPELQPDPVPVPEVAEKPVEVAPPEPAPEPEPIPPTPEPPQEAEAPETPELPEPQPDPVEVARVEPKPEPPQPEDVIQQVPEPDPLADIIENAPEVEPEPVEARPQETAPPAPAAPAPRLNPIPREQRLASARPDLLDKKEPKASAGGKPERAASKGTQTGRRNAKLTQNELDGLRDAIQKCWALPPGYSAGRDFSAKIRTQLSQDGSINGRVNVVSVTGFDGGPSILVKKAVRDAIQGCAPYKLPSNKYAEWKDLEVTFFP